MHTEGDIGDKLVAEFEPEPVADTITRDSDL